MKTCLGLFEYCFAISYNFISFLFYVPVRPLVKKALQRFLIYLGGVMSLESSSLAYQVMMVAYYNQQTKRQKNLLPIWIFFKRYALCPINRTSLSECISSRQIPWLVSKVFVAHVEVRLDTLYISGRAVDTNDRLQFSHGFMLKGITCFYVSLQSSAGCRKWKSPWIKLVWLHKNFIQPPSFWCASLSEGW